MWALLALYRTLRTVMVAAAESVPGIDPDRAGFTVAVHAARDSGLPASLAFVPGDHIGVQADVAQVGQQPQELQDPLGGNSQVHAAVRPGVSGRVRAYRWDRFAAGVAAILRLGRRFRRYHADRRRAVKPAPGRPALPAARR
jgi:hypothetical protein